MTSGARERCTIATWSRIALWAAIGAAGCSPTLAPEFRGEPPLTFPEPDAVDAVVFLIGDAGAALRGTSPVLRHLGENVEYWSERLVRDSAVTVAFLGDNVYPVGIRDRDTQFFPEDSSRLWSQIDVLDGPFSRARGAAGVFLAGNHDWGNSTGRAGLARLHNQEALLDSARAAGTPVWLLPEAGDPGPQIRDVRSNVRMVALDTHWFLQSPSDLERDAFFERVDRVMEEAEDRHVIMLAHHPYQSAGPHGLLAPGARAVGLMYLMQKSGTLIQDLNSPLYRDFRTRLRAAFRRGGKAPLVFAAGHDHSLQVLDPDTQDGPGTILVSGAGSKLTQLAEADNLRYAAARPGYMALIFRRNEAVDLYVFAAESADPTCPEEPIEERVVCMDRETAGIQLVYSERLAPEQSIEPMPPTAGGGGR